MQQEEKEHIFGYFHIHSNLEPCLAEQWTHISVGRMDNSVMSINYKDTDNRKDDLEYVSNCSRPLGDSSRGGELLVFV